MRRTMRRKLTVLLGLVVLSGFPSQVRAQANRASPIRFEEIGEKAGVRHLHFGLGSVGEVDELEIRWPNGDVERVRVPLNQLSVIQEGKGLVKP